MGGQFVAVTALNTSHAAQCALHNHAAADALTNKVVLQIAAHRQHGVGVSAPARRRLTHTRLTRPWDSRCGAPVKVLLPRMSLCRRL